MSERVISNLATASGVSPASSDAVRGFSSLSRADVDFAGGKGANLGELTAAGFPVPPGFVVGAPAYAAFCDPTGLRERIEERLSAVDVEDTAALDAAAEETRRMVESAPIPGWLAESIRDAYAKLAGHDESVAVAVRSSATAEDTESASFAGMNETFLNVTGSEDVVDAVRRCWASLFGARTVYYRAKRGFGQADMDIAVVVQRQIRSTRAGVMFTIDPASGATDRLVIEGAFGLGESVVSGSVSPDRYLVDKERLTIERREVRRKELAIESVPGGGTVTRELSGQEAELPVLSDEQVGQLAELGTRIEAHYGSPQDTEWAVDEDGAIWMLQSRPVTASGGTALAEPETRRGKELVRGLGAAPGAAAGPARVVASLTGRRQVRRRRGAGRPHDRARLGAADAQGGGDRHRLRRHDLPRRDRLPRARHPLRGRHRRGDQGPARRRDRHRRRRRGRRHRGRQRRRELARPR